MLTENEKEYLRMIVTRELEAFKKNEMTTARESSVAFLKAEHEYGHFLEQLVEKLK